MSSLKEDNYLPIGIAFAPVKKDGSIIGLDKMYWKNNFLYTSIHPKRTIPHEIFLSNLRCLFENIRTELAGPRLR